MNESVMRRNLGLAAQISNRGCVKVEAAPGQTLVVYHAEPGTPSAERMTLLATLAGPDPADRAR